MMDTRLKILRQSAGLSEKELAEGIGVSHQHYSDLEVYPEELQMTLSLFQILRICAVLHVTPRRFFNVTKPAEKCGPAETSDTFASLAETIKSSLLVKRINAKDFGDMVGWDIEDFLTSAEHAMMWNLDELKDVSAAVQCDWIACLEHEYLLRHRNSP